MIKPVLIAIIWIPTRLNLARTKESSNAIRNMTNKSNQFAHFSPCWAVKRLKKTSAMPKTWIGKVLRKIVIGRLACPNIRR